MWRLHLASFIEKGSKVSTSNAGGMALPPQLRQAGGCGLRQEKLLAGSLESWDTQGLLTSGSGAKGLGEPHKLPAHSGIYPPPLVLSQEVGG